MVGFCVGDSNGTNTTLSSDRTIILGIVNITPDSFSDGGVYLDPHRGSERALALLNEGADVIDVGAVSTRPGAAPVSSREERARLIPALEKMLTIIDASRLCVDVMSPDAIRWALSRGIRMFNFCGGLPLELRLRRQLQTSGSLMIVYPHHTTCDAQDPVRGRWAFFETQRILSKEAGIPPQQLLLDPGIGFGVDVAGSVVLLQGFKIFKTLGHPLVVGVSRKNHLARLLGREPSSIPYVERIEAGLAATSIAVLGGATHVRTHDVLPTKRFLTALDAIQSTA